MEGSTKRGRGRGRGGRGRGRGRGGGRGRGKKATKIIESDEEVETTAPAAPDTPEESQVEPEPITEEVGPPTIDLEADISQLEAPTFTTINRGPPEPMLRLNWDHKVNLIGEKVLNPMIHCCDTCLKPILIYGRMIPCKHVFCLACGKKEQKECPRCLEKVSRVEQTGLGTVFMCSHGGSRYGTTGCRRTYLSQRDLQAHINHRHVSSLQVQQPVTAPQPMEVVIGESERSRSKANLANDPRSSSVQTGGRRASQIQTSGIRTNLITVPIQETTPPVIHENISTNQNYYNQYQQANLPPSNYGQGLPPMHIPPPQPQPQYYATPPAYSPAAPAYSAYGGTPHTTGQSQYLAPAVPAPPRVAQPYDYSTTNPQWTNNQQYYR